MRLQEIGFSCWELIFAIFRKYTYPLPSIDSMFVLIEYVHHVIAVLFEIISNNTTIWCAVSISLYTALFSELKRQVVIEQICSNFYLREFSFADRWKIAKIAKLRTRQNFRATRYLKHCGSTICCRVMKIF